MAKVNRIITDAWRKLPPAVVSYAGFSNLETGAPSSRVIKTILPTLLSRTAEDYSFSALHWRREYELSDRIAAAIRERLAAAGARLSLAVEWHRELLAAYRDWVVERGSEPADSPQEWLMGPSLALATRSGAPGEDARDQARAEMSRKAGPPRGPTAKDAQRYLVRNARDLDALLDEAWTDGYRGGERGDTTVLLEALESYQHAAFEAQGEQWSSTGTARERAMAAWDEVTSLARSGLGAAMLQLSASFPPERPALRGASRDQESRPLDRSIQDRIGRIFKSADAVVVVPLDEDGPMDPPSFAETTARELIETVIAESPEAYGLSQPPARGLLLIVHRMTLRVAWQPDRKSREVAQEFSTPSDRFFVQSWDKVGWHYREQAHAGSTFGRMLESPASLFVARMWSRAARTQFQEAAWRPDARMAWEHATGVFSSIVKNAPQLYRYSQETGRTVTFDERRGGDEGDGEERSDPFEPEAELEAPGAPLPAFEAVVQEVLDVGRRRDGADAVDDFWVSIEDGDESPRELWDSWVDDSERRREEVPDFDQVQQYAIRRGAAAVGGPTSPPTLADVLAVTDFVSRRGERAREAVSALFRHVLEEPEIAPDDPHAATWDRWSVRYATHRTELGEPAPTTITFEQMARLVRAGADDIDDSAGSE